MTTLDLPPNNGPDRDEAILAYIQAGDYTADLRPVTSKHNGKTATFYVFADALKIRGVRVNASARLLQTIADMLGCLLLTPKIADLAWMQATVRLPPFPRPITSSTAGMLQHSADIDKALAKLNVPSTAFIQTVGKIWVSDNDLLTHSGRAENYGWHFQGPDFGGLKGEVNASLQKDKSGQYIRLIQGRGWAHDMTHTDYSQIMLLMSQTCEVDGQSMETGNLLLDPDLAPLGSHQGVMRVFRQPGVPVAPLMTTLLPTVDITATPPTPENIS